MSKTSSKNKETSKFLSKERIDPLIYQKLFDIGRRLLTETEVDRLLTTAMDEAIEISCAERGMIILFDNSGGIQFQTARNLDKEDIENPEFEISRTIIQQVKTKKLPICLKNALEDTNFKKSKSVEQLQILSVICLPLVYETDLFGVVYLDNRKFAGIFKPETFNFVQEFTKFISLTAFQALQRKRLQHQINELENELRGKYKFESLIGQHPKMVSILKLIAQVANSSASVLIQGESGTGKELIAEALHYNSQRRNKPFIPINCGAIPEHLLESELFGHVRGAFTGAITDKAGWFERADGGTIFLDEINDMSPALQVRLLRVLQTGEYSRIGSTEIQHCDVRVVAASSRNLQTLIHEGKFREEVYYRLNVIDIILPPLRERKSDVLLLANHYLRQFGMKYDKKELRLSSQVEAALLSYDFPGNVRELVNVMQRAVVLTEDNTINLPHLPEHLSKGTTISIDSEKPLNFRDAKQQAVEAFEREYLIKCLESSNGNITNAANIAGMHAKNFHVKMTKYGIDPNEFKK